MSVEKCLQNRLALKSIQQQLVHLKNTVNKHKIRNTRIFSNPKIFHGNFSEPTLNF